MVLHLKYLILTRAGDYLQRRYRIVLRSTLGPIDVYLVSQFDDGFENLGGAATPPRHTNVPKPGPCEDLHATNATQSSKSINVEYTIQHRQNTPQDPSSSNDYGGMTRIIPSDVNTDADYWLLTEGDVSITDMWETAQVQWDTAVFLPEDVSTPHAHHSPRMQVPSMDQP
uniref:Uncharacterized protein n=1 Tax=Aegilops tauschii subsp. strangulata TaxID=200361 RepID=A0A453NYB5_AEGTS